MGRNSRRTPIVLFAAHLALGCGRSSMATVDDDPEVSPRPESGTVDVSSPDASLDAVPIDDARDAREADVAPLCPPEATTSRVPPERVSALRPPTFTRWFEISSIDLIFGAFVALPVNAARIVFQVGEPPFAGALMGAVPAATAMSALTPALRDLGICGPPSLAKIQNAVRDAADLVGDAPSLQEDGRACDAISLGLGFTAPPTSRPTGAFPRAPIEDRCSP